MDLLLLVVVAGLAALFLIPGSTPRMDIRRYPNSLAVLEQVPVNDTQQWILIRSESVTNPVVLFVHGGPGTSWLTLMRKNTRLLEKYFTVVNWDQRGAGKSFAAGRVDTEMTMGAFVDDLIALSSDLARRFHKNKILLAGHSWGSVIRSTSGALGVVLKNLVFSREYTMLDRINFFRGVLQSVRALYPELSRIDLFVQVPEVKIPVYFCLGRHDYEVPSVLSAKYFEALKAPRKQLVWFERSAHLLNTEEKDKFNEFMIKTVLPTLPE
jgi:pimeloyl-ACP methyl ester carboxylesterase